MGKIEFKCPVCGKTLSYAPEHAGAKGKCSACGSEIVAPPIPTEPASGILKTSFSKLEPLGAPPSPPSSITHPSKPEPLPEKMRANRIIAGRICGHCEKSISLGDPVVNCPYCNSSMHQSCFDKFPCCATPLCKGFEEKTTPMSQFSSPYQAPGSTPVQPTQMLDGDHREEIPIPPGLQIPQPPDSGFTVPDSIFSHQMRPCPFCGEMIQRIAKKCRFCNEFLDDSLRKEHAAKAAKPEDDLSVGDVLFCILCSVFACILGIVYTFQGKKKGPKIILISIVSAIVWTIIQAAFQR